MSNDRSQIINLFEKLGDKKYNFKNIDSCKIDKIKTTDVLDQVNLRDDEYLTKMLENINLYMRDKKTFKEITLFENIIIEIKRQKMHNELINSIEGSKKTIKVTKANVTSQITKLNNMTDKVEKIQNDFITMLSIFAAVIIAFIGGLSMIGSSLQYMGTVSKYRLVFVLIIIGLTMFNVIYMLLYIISKISNKDISMNFNSNNVCKNCNRENRPGCLIRRHPILFYYNLFSIIGLFLDYAIYMFDKYDVFAYFLTLTNIEKFWIIPILGFLILIVLAFAIRWFVLNYIENKSCNNHINSNGDVSDSENENEEDDEEEDVVFNN